MSGLSWGILGTGAIAQAFARAVAKSDSGTLARIGSRTPESAAAFIAKLQADEVPAVASGTSDTKASGDYDALLADLAVDAVYIATPHTSHAQWAVRAAEAGKHVLVEKPAALNHADTMAMVEAARAAKVFFMEAFMYRLAPQTRKLVELIEAGEIGRVRMIEASFGFHAPFNAESRLFSNALGGGGIMDVGLYPVSMARLVAGANDGRGFLDPVSVQGKARLGRTGVDEWAAALLQFDNDVIAQVSTAVSAWLPNTVNIFGETGSLHLAGPWHAAGVEGGSSAIELRRFGKDTQTIDVAQDRWLYEIEADHVADCVARGLTESPLVPVADTLGNMRTLDAWRADAGFAYQAESRHQGWPTVSRRALAQRPGAPMQMRAIEGVARPVSALVMGCDNQTTMPHAAVQFDDFVMQGGNCFDTAHLYGGGIMEKLLGRWIEDRGIRDDVVLICKGAHTPDCRPDAVRPQLEESLDRLRTDRADIYFLHRDDPQVPIAEWVDLLNELKDDGKLSVFGGSNWSMARMQEANAYAAANGKQGFTVLSNNFSLARMNNPIWPGVMSCSDDAYRTWLEETGTALFSWSSQARGFFTERAGPDIRADTDLMNAFYSDDNFERRRRAYELSDRKSVHPMTIALAYVLGQKMPTCALVGPRTLAELRTSLDVFQVELSDQEIAWLDLRD
ncbi:aldo/keto reductase [Pyruvatibacter mobilis]|uniref:aldo/keto reductase n=1 Tax=Pyruvatibacter mobilis TaxID=1712261 RepID=UPI003BAD7DAB